MKPNFALTLSFDGIGLLHRSDSGWLSVWDVQLNDPDLAGALQVLVKKARQLDPSGITTKVVVPNQQIRYLTFESDSRDLDILDAQVRNTLNGATPYDVSELAYDWSMTGGEVCVAAVAIETLTEAESFAVDHGLGPLSFVAIPDDGAFQGEPFFGETVHAGEVLQPGDSVERDEEAIIVVGKATFSEPEQTVAPQVAEAEALSEPEPETQPVAEEDTVTPIVGFQSARSAKPAEPAATDDAPPVEEAPAPQTEEDTPDAEDATPKAPMVAFSSARRAPAADADAAPTLPQGRLSPGGTDTPAVEDTPKPAPEDPAIDAPAPEAVDVAPPAPPIAASKAPTAVLPDAPKRVPPAPTLPPEFETVAQARADTLKEPVAPIRPTDKSAPPASKHPGKLPFLSRRKSDTDTRAPVRPAAETGKKWAAHLGSGLTKARSVASGLRRKPASPSLAQRSAAQAAEDERQRMTVFGARNPDNTTAESNPRFLALAVTAGLLLILVGIAAWAAVFLEGGISSLFRSSEDVQFAEDPAAIEAPAELPEDEDTQIAALPQDPPRDTEDLADEPLITLESDDVISEELSADEVRARYAATGIWQRSPQQSRAPIALQFEDVYQTSLDPDLNFSDAVALPNVALLLPSARPTTPPDPLRPGEDNLERDERGFVIATPDGTVTLDGITIFSGAPPLTPPATPDRPEPDVAETEPEGEADPTVEAAIAAALPAENVGLRPRSRPADLTDSFERSNNGGRTLDELQTIKPRARPQSPQEQALAEAGISPEIEDDADDPFVDATEEAVQASLKPRTRPANFADIVEQTRETAATEPVSIEQRVAVSIPSTASVARAATERNQIALRRVNLIGVYGSAESRRALVRLPNGRYQKVEVGDRLDGGQVAAIGADELRYIKRGQSVVLKMPRS